ncbi:unnamed protein product [Paramecium sonneborni]|uniref:Tetratricopeptide repeat protein n=1 Tax=Paramecium sonneborni TaxID=65129 RepID=A0A8S1R3Z0_9CILI|nr:unnamed protein product [Paramecium sonneborni]
MISAINQDQQQQYSKHLDLKQNMILNFSKLFHPINNQLGIELQQQKFHGIQLNEQKWQQAQEFLFKRLKQLEKEQSFASFFQSISLYQMNQCQKAYNLREYAKQIINNFYIDLFNHSELELKKNAKNKCILIAKSDVLNQQKQYESALQQCDLILNEEPQNLHAINRKRCSLDDLEKYNDAIICYDKAIQIDPNYAIACFYKGNSLYQIYKNTIMQLRQYRQILFMPMLILIKFMYNLIFIGNQLCNLQKYNDAINCYEKVIKIDPNYVIAYCKKVSEIFCFQKAIIYNLQTIHDLQKFNDAIYCYDKEIQINPNDADAFLYKESLKKYDLALQNYDQSIMIAKINTQAFKNKDSLTKMKNYLLTIKVYDQIEFIKLIEEIKNSQSRIIFKIKQNIHQDFQIHFINHRKYFQKSRMKIYLLFIYVFIK